jgi:hypothetical protein
MVSAMTWTSSSRSTGGDPADEFANSASYAGPAKKTLYIEAIDDRLAATRPFRKALKALWAESETRSSGVLFMSIGTLFAAIMETRCVLG